MEIYLSQYYYYFDTYTYLLRISICVIKNYKFPPGLVPNPDFCHKCHSWIVYAQLCRYISKIWKPVFFLLVLQETSSF